MSLFSSFKSPDRTQTQLAYRVKYWPFHELSSAGRALLLSQRKRYLHKHQITDRTNEDQTILYANDRAYKIVWAYNNVPTEEEWNKRGPESLIACEFRSSPAIKEFAVVILSFELPSIRMLPHRKGEL